MLFDVPGIHEDLDVLSSRRGARAALARLTLHTPTRPPASPVPIPYLDDVVLVRAWIAAEYVAMACEEPAPASAIIGVLPEAMISATLMAWQYDPTPFDALDCLHARHAGEWILDAWGDCPARAWSDVHLAQATVSHVEDLLSRLTRAAHVVGPLSI